LLHWLVAASDSVHAAQHPHCETETLRQAATAIAVRCILPGILSTGVGNTQSAATTALGVSPIRALLHASTYTMPDPHTAHWTLEALRPTLRHHLTPARRLQHSTHITLPHTTVPQASMCHAPAPMHPYPPPRRSSRCPSPACPSSRQGASGPPPRVVRTRCVRTGQAPPAPGCCWPRTLRRWWWRMLWPTRATRTRCGWRWAGGEGPSGDEA
jgi:hypothetical protein